MANCKFEEAINKMKDLLQKHLGGRLTSEATKEILKAKLDGLKGIELQVRKLQGTVRVTSGVVGKEDSKGYNGKIDVTDPVASMKVAKEMELQKERDKGKLVQNNHYMKVYVDADKLAFMQNIHDERVKHAVESLDSIVMQTIKPSMVENSISTLLHYTLENSVVTMGKYDSTKNRVVLSTLLEEEAHSKARELAVEKYINIVYGDVDIEQSIELESKLKENKEFMDYIEPSVKAIGAEIWANYLASKGRHEVSHELVHAGAVVYMKNNPNSELTNRVKELYKLALDNVPHAPDTYWAQNVDEFLAETLTNPAIIKSMNAVRVPGKSINTTIMTDLLNTVLAMLGLKKESTIYQETLNSYAGILEQVAYTKVGADLEDVVHKAVDSLKMKQLLLQGMKDC